MRRPVSAWALIITTRIASAEVAAVLRLHMAPFVARRELTMTTIRPKPRAGSLLRSAATVFAAALLALPPAAHADPVTGGGYTPDFEGHLFRLIGADFDLRENELMFYPEWTLA